MVGEMRKRIIPIRERVGLLGAHRSPMDPKGVGYLEACRLTRGKGGLPSHVLVDDYWMDTKKHEGVGELAGVWPREILAHPEKGGVFERGKDVVDSSTHWVLPARFIPEEATGREKVGLFIDPHDFLEEGRGIIVIPRTIVVLSPFIQESRGIGVCGKVDDATRIPLETDDDALKTLPREEKRWLNRYETVRVGPLYRGISPTCSTYAACYVEWDGDLLNSWPTISAGMSPETRCKAAYVEPRG